VRAESALSRALVGAGFVPNAAVRLVQSEVLRSVLPRVRPVVHPTLETGLAAMAVAARAWLAAELYAWLVC
jgi:hypothetical protein